MAQYDFSTPINVTMIFDDSDEEKNEITAYIKDKVYESICLDDDENTETIKDTNNSTDTVISSKECRNEISMENQVSLNCNSDVPTVINKNTQPINKSNCTVDGAIAIDQNSYIQATTGKPIYNSSVIYQQINDKEELTAYVKDLLNTLSEHLILIMQPYYHYYYKNPNTLMSADLATRLNRLKMHFFDLSYSTVVSLILPQENDEIFINRFIDKTVTDANKVMNWKCGRHHVEPFYNEMVEWARQKRAQIKSISLLASNDTRNDNNRMLREKLSNPPRSLNITQPIGAPLAVQNNNKRRSSDIENNTCIFSCESSGGEVSINIIPNTIIKQNQPSAQQVPANNLQRPGKIYNPPRRQGINDNRIRHSQQNAHVQSNTVHHKPVPPQSRQPPPTYGVQAPNMSAAPPNYHHALNEIQKNIQAMQNYHRNLPLNPYTGAVNINSNLGVMFNPQNVGQPTVITGFPSSHPVSNVMIGRCCICGKNTNLRCSKCNNFSYCSYLCQELDSGAHKIVCGKTNN